VHKPDPVDPGNYAFKDSVRNLCEISSLGNYPRIEENRLRSVAIDTNLIDILTIRFSSIGGEWH
jgi:hypothetical protein